MTTEQDEIEKIKTREESYHFEGFDVDLYTYNPEEDMGEEARKFHWGNPPYTIRGNRLKEDHPLRKFVIHLGSKLQVVDGNKDLIDKVLQICDEEGEFTWKGRDFKLLSAIYTGPSLGSWGVERHKQMKVPYQQYVKWKKPKKILKEITEIIKIPLIWVSFDLSFLSQIFSQIYIKILENNSPNFNIKKII